MVAQSWPDIRRTFSDLPRGSFALLAISLVTVALGFIRETVIAFYFGISSQLDSFLVALALPKLMAAQALLLCSAAIVPRYVKARQSASVAETRSLAQRWVLTTAGFALGLSILLAISAPLLMTLLGPGLTSAAQQHASSWFLMLLPYAWIIVVASAFKGLLESRERFVPAALTNLMVSASTICICVLFAQQLGINAIVVGMLAGSAIALMWQVSIAARIEPGLLKFSRLSLSTDGLPITGLMLLSIGAIASQARLVIDRAFVSHLEPGSIAALNYAEVLTSLPSTILVSAAATVLLPTLSALSAQGKDRIAFRLCCRWAAVIAAVSVVPILLLVAFRHEIVAFVFERGAFSDDATFQTAGILVALPYMIFISSISVIVNRLFIAYEKTSWIAGLGVLSLAIKVLLNILLIGPFGLVGIAMSTVISAGLVTTIRFVVLWRFSLHPAAQKT